MLIDFCKKGLLNICKIPNIMNHPKGVIRGTDEITNKIFYGLAPSFRLVAKMNDKYRPRNKLLLIWL